MAGTLKDLWCLVLDHNPADVHADTDFFEAGGDSVDAIKLAGLARDAGLPIDAQIIFNSSKFSSLQQLCEEVHKPSANLSDQTAESTAEEFANGHSVTGTVKPLAGLDLLKSFDLVESCLSQCNVPSTRLVDVLPCSPFQAELMTASHNFGLWMFQSVFQLEAGNQMAVRNVFETIQRRNPIFRTRIAQYGTELYQVILDEPVVWNEVHESLGSYKARDQKRRMTYGDPLCRFAIVHDSSSQYFVWTKTHAIYDRWSKMHFLQDVHDCLADPANFVNQPARPPFRNFVQAIRSADRNRALSYWQSQLQGLERYDILMPGATHRNFISRPDNSIRKHMKYIKPKNTRITFSTITHLAWALCLANETGQHDIFFNAFRSCRQMSIANVESIIGPCWSMVPVRIKLNGDASLRTLLGNVQKDIVDGTPYEPFGLEALQERFSHNGYLQSVLLPQPPQPPSFEGVMTGRDSGGAEVRLRSLEREWTQASSHYGLYIMLTPKGETLELWARFDESFISGYRVHKILDEYIEMLKKITLNDTWDDTTVGQICPHIYGQQGHLTDYVNGSGCPNNGSATLARLFQKRFDDSTAVLVPSENTLRVSHNDLKRHVDSFQKDFAELGIKEGSAVSLVLGNSYEMIVAFIAATLQRGIAAPLNPGYKQGEFEFYIGDLGSNVVLIPGGSYEENGPAVKAARKYEAAVAEVLWNGTKVVLDVKERGNLKDVGPQDIAVPEEEDIALVLHTSGTTGRPKAVPLTHKNLSVSIDHIIDTYQLKPEDRTMLIMPLFHVHGLLASFLSPLKSGGCAIIPQRLTPSFWNQFVTYGATWYSATPTMHRMIIGFPPPDPVPPIRFIRSCSSQLAPALFHELEKKFNCPVLESYAMTEASHLMTSNPLPPRKHLPGCVGQPQGVDLKILNESGKEVLPGEEGEVCIRGGNVTKGYLNNADANKSSFTEEGFFRTGDQGKADAEGYLFLTGRLKELINKGGEKISPVELDNVINQHDDIQECVSFGVEDEDYGQEIGCAIRLKDDKHLDAKDLKAWISRKIAAHKVPKKIWFPDEIPKTATGKVQRKAVAEAMTKS